MTNEPPRLHRPITRRAWLAGVAAGWAGLVSGAAPPGDADEEEQKRVADRARAAGLPALKVNKTEHYLALGDAPEAFLNQALPFCEELAVDFLKHFGAKGFRLSKPDHRLSLVILNDDREFAAYLGKDPGATVGGVYDPNSNELVLFDFRNQTSGAPVVNNPRFANTLSLAHEATHQLTFNTGLLRRRGDVPKCISEGLAMYAEIRSATRRIPMGKVNDERLRGLAYGQRQGNKWIAVERLLADDGPIDGDGGPGRQQLAYAESWLLVHWLLQEPRVAGFRAYLDAIRDRDKAAHRVEDARGSLGDLARLDQDLRNYAVRLMKSKRR